MLIKSFVDSTKKIGLKKTFQYVCSLMYSSFISICHRIRWFIVSHIDNYSGVSSSLYKEEVVVSLTSYPKRIDTAHITIETLLMQKMKPNKVILWLADSEFPDKKIPSNIECLIKYGLTIEWTQDIKSYKKLIPALHKYPNAIIMTFDDDIYYSSKIVKKLYDAYLTDPLSISCNRVSKLCLENNEYHILAGGYNIYNTDTYLHKLTGCGGVCYPPKSLYKDVTNIHDIMKLAPTNDDIWFWAMALLNSRMCKLVKNNNPFVFQINKNDNNSLSSINDRGEQLFWKDFHNIISKYPQIDTILRNEQQRVSRI